MTEIPKNQTFKKPYPTNLFVEDLKKSHAVHFEGSLIQYSSAVRLTRYITFRTIIAMLTAFFISLLIGRWVINFLYSRNIRDVVRDYSVMSVESKRGTPTMGGCFDHPFDLFVDVAVGEFLESLFVLSAVCDGVVCGGRRDR